MKFDEWLATIPIRETVKGARLDLRLCVYPDGHGNFYVEDEHGQLCDGQPVNNPDEARQVLERVWDRAMSVQPKSPPAGGRKSLADQLGDLIGSVPDLPGDMAEHHDHYLHGAPRE